MEAEEEGSLVVHSDPSDGKAIVLELDLDLGKEGTVDNQSVPHLPDFVAEVERWDQRR